MGESVEKIDMVICSDLPEQKIMTRRIVQSTLFGYKPPEAEPKRDQKIELVEDKDSDAEDVDLGGSQGKANGRKRKAKATPQKRTPKKAKEKSQKSPANCTPKKKSPSNSTPKTKSPASSKQRKSCTNNGKMVNTALKGEDAPPLIPNLRLEAKLTAEENSRMYAGKQIHPFFSSLKMGKKNQETTEQVPDHCSTERRDKSMSIGPIHVFERIQDDDVAVVLDWKNWTFSEKTSIENNCRLEGVSTSAFQSCVEALQLSASDCHNTSIDQEKLSDQCVNEKDDMVGTSPAIPVVLEDEDIASFQDCEVAEIAFISGHAGGVDKSKFDEQSQDLLKGKQPDDNLWAVKYQPTRAIEVCGNNEAVKFMNEWLHLWHGRDARSIKDPANVGKFNTCDDDDGDDDYDSSQHDSDSENEDGEDSLKNVLLITGPVGCGKTAAIRACAKEQGFEVLESNASDFRNGAQLKQQFGEALESHCLARSQEGGLVSSQSKHFIKSSGDPRNAEATQPFDLNVVEIIPIPDEEDSHDSLGTPGNHLSNGSETGSSEAKIKSLILFEDIDIIFPDDRGFLTAIKQIAEKAKGPVILTSNSDNPDLPNNLDRLELCFTLPSLEELLPHLSKVCTAEKTNIQPSLIEQLTKYFRGDIRKTMMHLQFWCQSKRYREGQKMQNMFGLLPFDIEAAHWALPNAMPWSLPSQLSEWVEKEISKSSLMMEETSTIIDTIEEGVETDEWQFGWDLNKNESDNSLDAKKDAMLEMNFSVHDCNEIINAPSTACEFSNSSGALDLFTPHKSRRRKLDMVVSSDSEDECFDKGASDRNLLGGEFLEEDSKLHPHFPTLLNCTNPLAEELHLSQVEQFDNESYLCSQTSTALNTDLCMSLDLSRVPESTYVAETEFDNGMEISSRTVSCANVEERKEESGSDEFIQNLLPVEVNHCSKSRRRLVKCSEKIGTSREVTGESSHKEVEDSRSQPIASSQDLMDECSRMVFSRPSSQKLKQQVVADLVQESWKELRNGNPAIKQCIASEPKDAHKVLKLAHGVSDLISQADQLIDKSRMLDSYELSIICSKKSDALRWCDEQPHMVDTILQHGFCFYSKGIDAAGLTIDPQKKVNSAQEMLASTTNCWMELGRFLRQDAGPSSTSLARKIIEVSPPKEESSTESETKSSLFSAIKSIVPPRSYLSLKGTAFHEYLSSLGCISRSEASRISLGIQENKRRRVRGARHYLSSGALMLSPEDISLLDQYKFDGRFSSSITDTSFSGNSMNVEN